MLEKIYNPLATNFDSSSDIYSTKVIPNNNFKQCKNTMPLAALKY